MAQYLLTAHCIDTHDGRVVEAVWQLYRLAHELTGGTSTLLEWDAQIPPFPDVHAAVLKAREYLQLELPPRMEVGEVPSEPAWSGPPSPSLPHPLHLLSAVVE